MEDTDGKTRFVGIGFSPDEWKIIETLRREAPGEIETRRGFVHGLAMTGARAVAKERARK
jgi:hypothetical protein